MSDTVLIVGAGGMLAWDLEQVFTRHLPAGSVVALSRSQMEIADPESVSAGFAKHHPRLVLNAAAFTDVDGAESRREEAHRANALGPSLLTRACADYGARLVHFSTDQVFDGTSRRARTEDETPNPVNNYGATKLAGEQEVVKYADSLVLRVQWLYGEKKDRFTPLRNREEFTPFADQYGCPTWTRWIADMVWTLNEQRATGLFHCVHDDYSSWAEVFQFVCETLKFKTRLKPTQTAGLNLPARRPEFSVLSNRKLCDALGVNSLGSWKDSLEGFLRRVQV